MGIVSLSLILFLALVAPGSAQTPPEKVYGTRGGGIALFDPDAVVDAGLPSVTGQTGKCLKAQADGPAWQSCPSGGGGTTPLSDATPQPDGTGAAGTADAASRGDHMHPAGADELPPVADQAGKALYVNSEADGVEWDDVPKELPSVANQAGKALYVNPKADGVEWDEVPKELPDAPVGGLDQVLQLNALNKPAWNFPAWRLPNPGGALAGDIARVKTDGSAYEVVDPHVAVLSGLPGLTGHGGNCLRANGAETGVEFGSCGSGGGGGNSVDIVLQGSWLVNNITTRDDVAVVENLSLSAPTKFFVVSRGRSYSTPGPTNIFITPQWRCKAGTTGCTGLWGSAGCTKLRSYPSSKVAAEQVQTSIAECTVPATEDADFGVDIRYSGIVGKGDFYGDLTVFRSTIDTGGGSTPSGPTIPTPSAAGALKHLRVNAAGAAYELADPPDVGGAVSLLAGQIATLQEQTFDLAPFGAETTWTKPLLAATAAIQVKPASQATSSISTGGDWTTTIPQPSSGWPNANSFVAVRVPTGQSLAEFRVGGKDSEDGTFLWSYGNTWTLLRTTGGHNYYNANWASVSSGVFGSLVGSFEVQKSDNADHDGETVFDGRLGPTPVTQARFTTATTTGILPAQPGAAKILSVQADGSLAWVDEPTGADAVAAAHQWRVIGTAKSTSTTQTGDFTILYPSGERTAFRATVTRTTDRPGRFRVIARSGSNEYWSDCSWPGPSAVLTTLQFYQGGCVMAVPESGVWSLLLRSNGASGDFGLSFFPVTSPSIATGITFQLQYRYAP